MQIIGHRIQPAKFLPSPHYNQRPVETAISLLVIHCISLPPKQFGGDQVEQFFMGKLKTSDHPYFTSIAHLKVSAHCYIKRTGELVQFVPFDLRAWHAGESRFNGIANCNDYSIGIELEGDDHEPYTDQQYTQLAAVTQLLQQHYPYITQDTIVGHEHIAPGRKTDPGPAFDWTRYFALLSAA